MPFLQPRVVRRADTGSPRAAAPALGASGEDEPGAGGRQACPAGAQELAQAAGLGRR
jgi:hypothetical protein